MREPASSQKMNDPVRLPRLNAPATRNSPLLERNS